VKLPVSFEFVDEPLNEALQSLSKSIKTPIVFAEDLGADAQSCPMTLRVSDMEAELAINWLCRLAELEYEVDEEKEQILIVKKARVRE
jgi:hypothetical protein